MRDALFINLENKCTKIQITDDIPLHWRIIIPYAERARGIDRQGIDCDLYLCVSKDPIVYKQIATRPAQMHHIEQITYLRDALHSIQAIAQWEYKKGFGKPFKDIDDLITRALIPSSSASSPP